MAELALGAISLGIQVCQGIWVFVDALNSRDKDLQSIGRQSKALDDDFQLIKSLIIKNELKATAPTAIGNIERCLTECESELNSLDVSWKKLTGVQSTNILTKLKEKARNFQYPFQRDELMQLRDQLGRISIALQLALQSAGLDVSLSAIAIQTSISADTQKVVQELPDLRDLAAANLAQAQTSHAFVQASSTAFDLKLDVLSTANQAQALQMDDMTKAFQDLNASLNARTEAREAHERFVVARLAGRPSLLRDFCDASSSASAASLVAQPKGHGVSKPCGCRQRTAKSFRLSQWGFFSFFEDSSAVQTHWASCPLSKYNPPETKKTRGVVLSRLPSTFIVKAVELSYCIRSGAGGLGISPQIYFPNIVDSSLSPTFRTLKLLSAAARYGPDLREQGQWNKLVYKALDTISRSFRDQRALPTDVNEENQNVLHLVAELVFEVESFGEAMLIQPLIDLAEQLVAYGAPMGTCDYKGRQPIHMGLRYRTPSKHALRAFFPGDMAIALYTPDHSGYFMHPEEMKGLFDLWCSWPSVREAFIGPLSSAVLVGDVDSVRRILRSDPRSIYEEDPWGNTPLHLAWDKPDCLDVLLQATDSPEVIKKANCESQTVLWFMMTLSGEACQSPNDPNSIDCPCIQSLRICLDRGYALVPPRDLRGPYDNAFQRASIHVKREVAGALAQARNALKALALEKLSALDIDACGISRPGVLDSRAARVYMTLRERGIEVPESLAVYLPSDINDYNNRHLYSRSVYYDLSTVEDAAIFQDLDFCDNDGYDAHLDSNWHEEVRRRRIRRMHSLSYVNWLFEHGFYLPWAFDISTWVYWSRTYTEYKARSNILAAAFVLGYTIGKFAIRWNNGDLSSWTAQASQELIAARNLHGHILTPDERNNSGCQCFPGSSTPLMDLLKGVKIGCHPYSFEPRPLKANALEIYARILGEDLKLWHYQAVVRVAAFEWLGIRHTCDPAMDSEEREELRSEDLEKTDLLEELLAEFESEASELFEKPSDLRVAGITEAFSQLWPERVAEALESKYSRSDWEKNKEEANALGVTWEASSTDESELGYDDYICMMEEL